MQSIQSEEATSVNTLENHVDGTIQKNNQKKVFAKRAELITKYSLELKEDKITPKYFLSLMSNLKNGVLYDDNEITIEDDEVEMSNGTELVEGGIFEEPYKQHQNSTMNFESDDNPEYMQNGADKNSEGKSICS